MTTNAEARLEGARDQVCLSEVAALQESLTFLRQRRAEAETDLARLLDPTAEQLGR